MMNRLPMMRAFLSPFAYFARSESAGGLLLVATAAVAMVWANLPWAHSYFHLKETTVGLQLGDWGFMRSLEFWVNDGLMAIFFLLVGLEIKREVLAGELAGVRRALWPAVAAIGGMIVPAIFYSTVNWQSDALRGWGIPMATDIAFALGIMRLLGNRVPTSLKVFLTALAIVDDLGAVLVIAIFYTETLHLASLGIVAIVLAACVLYSRLHGRYISVFLALGAVMWYYMYRCGVHPTVAGVLLAMTIPIGHTRRGQDSASHHSPLHRLEHTLAPWVAFAIMPIFALFNAGIGLGGGTEVSTIGVGIFLGLLLGKPIGIVGATWLAAKLRIINLPAEARWPAMIGTGLLGGIGFTMSLFVAMLAFPGSAMHLDQAKLAILATSVVAAISGLIVLRCVATSSQPQAS